jgi:hypothetical protein
VYLSPLNMRLKSEAVGTVRNIIGSSRSLAKKLGFLPTIVCLSKTKAGSRIVAKARSEEAREKTPSWTERRMSGKA